MRVIVLTSGEFGEGLRRVRAAPWPRRRGTGLLTPAAAAADVVAAGVRALAAEAPNTPARPPVPWCLWRAPRSLRDGWAAAAGCVAPMLAAGVDGGEAAIAPAGVAPAEAVVAGALVGAGWGAAVGEAETPPWAAGVALLPSPLSEAPVSVWPEEVAEPEPSDSLLPSPRRARWRDSRGRSSRAFSSWGRSARGRSLGASAGGRSPRGCSSRGRSSLWRPPPRGSCAGSRDSCSATRWACPGLEVWLAGAPAGGWVRLGLARAGALPSAAMQARNATGGRCRRGVRCGRCSRASLTIAESAPINSSELRVPACERGPPRASQRSRTLHRAQRTRRSSAQARSRRRSRSAHGDRGAG